MTALRGKPTGGQSAGTGAGGVHLVPVLGKCGQRFKPEPERIVGAQNRRYEQGRDTSSSRHHFDDPQTGP
jgi:hypothetical protein